MAKTFNTINPVAIVRSDGREVVASGPIQCDEGHCLQLRVTVTQETTAAVAEAVWDGECAGRVQKWEVTAVATGECRFEEGLAKVCALATTTHSGKGSDADQWCKDVVLVKQF